MWGRGELRQKLAKGEKEKRLYSRGMGIIVPGITRARPPRLVPPKKTSGTTMRSNHIW